jgi:hypothetical protein
MRLRRPQAIVQRANDELGIAPVSSIPLVPFCHERSCSAAPLEALAAAFSRRLRIAAFLQKNSESELTPLAMGGLNGWVRMGS